MAKTVELLSDRPAPPRANADRPRVRPTLDDVWLVVILAAPAFLMLISRLRTVDLAYHLRLGALIRTTGTIPNRDVFTFTALGTPWVDQQWLSQLVLFLGYRAGGFAGLIVLRAAMVAAISGLVFVTCRSRGGSVRTSSLLAFGAFLMAMPYLSMRPQLFGALCFAAAVYLVTTRAEGRARLWIVPLLTVVWANVHGSFVFAPALVAFAVVDDLLAGRRAWSRSAWALIATVIASCLTPFGPGVWKYAVSLMSNDLIRTSITEWSPPSFATLSGTMFLVGLLVLGISIARRSEPVPVPDVIWVTAFSLLAMTAHRNILWWAIAVPPVVAGAIGTRARSRDADTGMMLVNVMVLGVVAIGLISATPWVRDVDRYVDGTPSTAMMARAREAIPSGARVFVYQPWASWVEFARPDVTVFVDSRIELYDAATWHDYETVADGADGWGAVLDRHEVDAVLVSAEQAAVIDGLSRAVGWEVVSIDGTGALFTRS